MSDVGIVNMGALRVLIASGSSGVTDALGQLRRAEAEILWNMSRPTATSAAEVTEERLLTPEQAAEIAGVPKERIYSWAKGQRWASRPTTRCLRISERGFRSWLASRGR
jgi:hypothetical protein